MAGGTVKEVDSERNVGLITGDDGKDYIFDRGGLASSLQFDLVSAGERVEFDVQAGQSRALNVARAGDHQGEGVPVDWGSPRWREVDDARQGNVEHEHRFRNDSSQTERGAIDRDGSVGHRSNMTSGDNDQA